MSAIIINSYRLSFLSLFVLVVGLLFISHAYSQEAEIYTEIELEKLIQKYSQDSILNLERLAAFEFHKLLNEYRVSNDLNALDWNETLWLTCRNHNYYMTYNDVLSHSQTETEKYFSGEGPGDRLAFVQDGNNDLSWSGENALYNYSSNGYNAEDIAKNIAQASFIQWKNSPGHNENMLASRHLLHGAAFGISDTKVYATSLFGYITSTYWTNYNKAEKNTSKSKPSSTINSKPNTVVKSSRINLSKVRKYLELELLEEFPISENNKRFKQDRVLSICAKKQVSYMFANNLVEHTQKRLKKAYYAKDLAKRIAKAEGKAFWFLNRKTDVFEYICLLEVDENNYNEENLYQQLFDNLINENNIEIDQIKDVGLSIRVKRKKLELFIYTTFLVRFK